MSTSVNRLLMNSNYSLCKEPMSNLAQITNRENNRVTTFTNGQHSLTILQWHSAVEYHIFQEFRKQNGIMFQIICGRVRLYT